MQLVRDVARPREDLFEHGVRQPVAVRYDGAAAAAPFILHLVASVLVHVSPRRAHGDEQELGPPQLHRPGEELAIHAREGRGRVRVREARVVVERAVPGELVHLQIVKRERLAGSETAQATREGHGMEGNAERVRDHRQFSVAHSVRNVFGEAAAHKQHVVAMGQPHRRIGDLHFRSKGV
jgi:hypothetical protein